MEALSQLNEYVGVVTGSYMMIEDGDSIILRREENMRVFQAKKNGYMTNHFTFPYK
jgi:hypothetical protein